MIRFVCASCQERLSVAEQFAGRKGACPSCGLLNRVPLRGFAETRGTGVARLAAQPSPRLAVTAPASTVASSAASTNGHALEAVDSNVVSACSFVDRTDRRDSLSVPSLPISRTIPVSHEQPVEIVAQPSAPVASQALEIQAAQREATHEERAHLDPASRQPPVESSAGISFMDAAVQALPDLPPETHESIYARRHALAPDQLTPGERWRQAFANEDARPSRWNRLLMRSRNQSASSPANEPAFTNISDEGFSTPAKLGLLLVGAMCLTGLVYAALHLMLWLGAGVQ